MPKFEFEPGPDGRGGKDQYHIPDPIPQLSDETWNKIQDAADEAIKEGIRRGMNGGMVLGCILGLAIGFVLGYVFKS